MHNKVKVSPVCTWVETYTNKKPFASPHYVATCGKIFNFYDKLVVINTHDKKCQCGKPVKLTKVTLR